MKFDRRGVILIAIICFAPFAYWAYAPAEPDNWKPLYKGIEVSERWSLTKGKHKRFRVGSETFDDLTAAETYLYGSATEEQALCLVEGRDESGKLVSQDYVPCDVD